MTRIFLTGDMLNTLSVHWSTWLIEILSGGSGFVAAHILHQLLEEGHSVVTSVRSEDKGQALKKSFPNAKKGQLDYVIVKDIAVEGAFENVIKSEPPFEIVIHTSSPFHGNVKDVKKDFLDPAIIGTTGLLKAVKKSAPTVKRVACLLLYLTNQTWTKYIQVITSSFAAIYDAEKGNRPGHTYSEKDWNPVTEEDAIKNPEQNGYRASKTFAEKKAWEFVETQKPNFSLATVSFARFSLIFRWSPVADIFPNPYLIDQSPPRVWAR